mmetsp:Transcript_14348/g.31089  ORF Transcript_14348/g.31089 Transcript_14348/m.31089 type:complete len:287 (-) Transcript_14348:321-1181(-)|eukprot:CAMPEP_0172308260 /NCGR_PEP_ID=MMETSP1058-20130122/8917_1 /TAXON_ID=83371 /ORGANISM="Detonula confervacea, Strain CCMP 353" /LENGTH=286 /DNA_ID=CAMNT_0013020639 /DNA_START=115 /DNA_END=975 /DNA_ORIENTATION=-
MIRAAFLRPSSTATIFSTACAPKNNNAAIVRYYGSSLSSSNPSRRIAGSLAVKNLYYGPLHLARSNYNPAVATRMARSTSSSTSNNQKDKSSQSTSTEGGAEQEPMSQEMVLTPGEKVVAGTRLFFWAGAAAFASVCAYYIGKELLPTKMSPNTIFDKASTLIQQHDEVKKRFGAVKTYGRDHGGHREGRRNFIEHTDYTDEEDGSKRTRVRFNLEGPYGTAFVFAEVSKDMPSGEFVYILVQDKRNGMVITVQDNRSALLAKKMAGGSQAGQDVFSTLLGGGGNK